MKGCSWILIICGFGALMLLAMLAGAMPESGQGAEIARATAMPSGNALTTIVQTIHGPRERPTGTVLLWGVFLVAAVFVAFQVKATAPAAKAEGRRTGYGEALATIALIFVVGAILLAVVLATMGGG